MTSRSPVLKTRELDQLIAEKVMGWRWRRGFATGPNGSPLRILTRYLDGLPEADGTEETTSQNHVPHYSSEIAPAFLVVEQMAERDGRFTLLVESDFARDRSLVWEAKFCSDIAIASEWWRSKSLPEAICLAALDALGFSPPEGVQR